MIAEGWCESETKTRNKAAE